MRRQLQLVAKRLDQQVPLAVLRLVLIQRGVAFHNDIGVLHPFGAQRQLIAKLKLGSASISFSISSSHFSIWVRYSMIARSFAHSRYANAWRTSIMRTPP